MSRRLRTILIILGVLVGILVVGFLVFRFYLVPMSFPEVEGRIQLPGLLEAVDIYRDPYGVPHIYATSEHDLFMAQGFVHAQERFWQMDRLLLPCRQELEHRENYELERNGCRNGSV